PILALLIRLRRFIILRAVITLCHSRAARGLSSVFTGLLHYSPKRVNNKAMNLDHTLIALADPTRRAILQRLSRGEARVTELAAPFDISLNSVSKHIRILERAGLVKRRVAGRDHFLSFDPHTLNDAAEWIDRHRNLWTRRLDALEAALRADDAIQSAKRR